MPHPKLELVRQRYLNTCGYCGVTETAVGGELTVDHFRPRSANGGEDDRNLVYACIKCNQYKGDFWPTDEDLANGRRLLHPLLDDLTAHLTENEQTGQLEGISAVGQFHIALLRLNRPQLVEHRLRRRIYAVLIEKHHLMEQQIGELQKTIEVQKRYIAMLEAHLEALM